MITKNSTQFREIAIVEASFSYEKIKPQLRQVSKYDLAPAISKEQLQELQNYNGTDTVILEAIELAKEVEVNLAMYRYLPIGALQISKGGINVVSPTGQQPAVSKDIRDNLRYYKSAGLKALDALLELMELNEAKFTQWKNSKQYTIFKSLLVNSTSDFQKHYNIFNSRQTFLSLISEIETVENQFIIPIIQKSVLEDLKQSSSNNDTFKQVKNLVAKAIVFYTVSKTLGSGLYFQKANGFEIRFDILDYERNFTDKDILNDFLKSQRKAKENEALNFLKSALNLIKANPTIFSTYQIEDRKTRRPFIAGKGIVGV